MFKSILLLAVLCALALAAPITTRSSTAVSLSKRGSSSGTYKGRGTWFSDTTGSCDIKFNQSDMIVALNQDQMGEINGSGSKCGQKVRVSYGGKSQVLTIVDTCPFKYCNSGDLDLSQAAFKNFADMSVGQIQLEWSFV
ncbi:hypothetical protein BGZ74_010714 [Mortierella antarctica]|nr:hypothetical protein BGZ74_010714 [Mortierella antarctica]